MPFASEVMLYFVEYVRRVRVNSNVRLTAQFFLKATFWSSGMFSYTARAAGSCLSARMQAECVAEPARTSMLRHDQCAIPSRDAKTSSKVAAFPVALSKLSIARFSPSLSGGGDGAGAALALRPHG